MNPENIFTVEKDKKLLIIGNQDSRFVLRKKFINPDNYLKVVNNQIQFYWADMNEDGIINIQDVIIIINIILNYS